MNAGFANLTSLKTYLLAPVLRSRTDWDAAITIIGQGVATAFENYCGRKFMRAAGNVEIIPADRCQFLLSRYPLETLTAVDLKMKESGGWVAQDLNNIISIDQANGVINFPEQADLGPWYAQARFTYTGGFFWEQLEPVDGAGNPTAGFPTAVPGGAALVPADLLEAWLMQCAENWKLKDKLGQGITIEEKVQRISAANLVDNLLPQVKSRVGQYVRYSLT